MPDQSLSPVDRTALEAARIAYREANRAVQARQRMLATLPDRGVLDAELASLRALRHEAATAFNQQAALVREARRKRKA